MDLFGYNKSVVQIGEDYLLCSNEMADGLATGRINPELDRIKNSLKIIEL
jgi:hypothetical protein